MSWRVAQSLLVLRAQCDAVAPHRRRDSDGTIGDPAHQSEGSASDHNPWVHDRSGVGVVRALDVTHDPAGGMDTYALAERLRIARDRRLTNGGYVISNRRIFSGPGGSHPAYEWRPYTGSNPHTNHIHISVSLDQALYDGSAPWEGVGVPLPGTSSGENWTEQLVDNLPTLSRGATGPAVANLQGLVLAAGGGVGAKGIDGNLGPDTEHGLAVLQAQHSIPNSVRADGTGDGIAGRGTWTWLLSRR